MYEKTFPIKVVQSPTHSTSSGCLPKTRPRCTAQEVIYESSNELCVSFISICCMSVCSYWGFSLTVCSRGGEGGLQAASYYGLWRSVVLSSQWQLTHYCEVSQRFVRIESMPCSCYKKCVMRYNFVFFGGGRERSMKGSFHIFLFCVAWNDMAFMCIEPETSKGIFFFSWCAHYHVAMVCGDQNSLPHFILLL